MSVARAVTPFHDSSRAHRFRKIAGWLIGTALVVVILNLLGVDVRAWLQDFWDSVRDIPIGYLIAGATLQIAQTTFNGIAYYGIFAYAYPGRVQLWPVITAYAVGVSMNNFLPANIGTFVTLMMFIAIIPGTSFAAVLAAYLVNKIFFTIVGGLVYVYLFLEAGSAFDIELGWFHEHPVAALLILAGAILLGALVVRICWRWLRKLWLQAKEGGKILESRKAYTTRVLAPQVASYAAKVGVICVFLAAYSIPVTVGSVMGVIGSSSAANMTAVTPGSVGINQAANAAALSGYTSAENATNYSLTQQLFTTMVNLGYALVLVVMIFGWTGGKLLVGDSYADAKVKAAEMKASRHKGGDDDAEAEDASSA